MSCFSRLAHNAKTRATRRARGKLFPSAAPWSPCVTVETPAATYLVRTDDTAFAPRFFQKRTRKEHTVLARAIEHTEREGRGITGSVFVDVGAHIGTTTLEALARGFESAVAIEAAPGNHRLLRANLALNNACGRVTAFMAAASDREGALPLALGRGASTKPRVVASHVEGAAKLGRIVSVTSLTLDALVARGTLDPAAIGLLWLDVEGHEPSVLRGAGTLLRHGVPLVLEVSPKLLDRAEGSAALVEALDGHYTHLTDLGTRAATRRPISALGDAIESLRPYGATDLLLIRSQVP